MTALLPFKLVYHERYDLNLGPHVFPSQKFRLIYEMLLREGIAAKEDFLRPNPASDEDILRVHTADWVRKLKTGNSRRCVTDSLRISAGDFIMRIRGMVKVSAQSMMWRWRPESCRRMARSRRP